MQYAAYVISYTMNTSCAMNSATVAATIAAVVVAIDCMDRRQRCLFSMSNRCKLEPIITGYRNINIHDVCDYGKQRCNSQSVAR